MPESTQYSIDGPHPPSISHPQAPEGGVRGAGGDAVGGPSGGGGEAGPREGAVGDEDLSSRRRRGEVTQCLRREEEEFYRLRSQVKLLGDYDKMQQNSGVTMFCYGMEESPGVTRRRRALALIQ